MESILPEWVELIISLISCFFLWLPLLVFSILLCVNLVYCTIQDSHLRRDYEKTLSPEDLKVIRDYYENTSFVRVQRRLRRIRKNFNNKK